MRILIDTNILISAALWPSSKPSLAYFKAINYPYHGIICEQSIDELRRVFNKKFPDRISVLNTFLSLALLAVEVVPVPEEAIDLEQKIRDVNDRSILRAAVNSNACVLLTGDNDFLESGIQHPRIMNAAELLGYECPASLRTSWIGR